MDAVVRFLIWKMLGLISIYLAFTTKCVATCFSLQTKKITFFFWKSIPFFCMILFSNWKPHAESSRGYNLHASLPLIDSLKMWSYVRRDDLFVGSLFAKRTHNIRWILNVLKHNENHKRCFDFCIVRIDGFKRSASIRCGHDVIKNYSCLKIE